MSSARVPLSSSQERLGLPPWWPAIVGAYTYGTERLPDGTSKHTFELAIETASECRLERLVSAAYRLEDYQDAIAHAAAAGRRGAVKIVFDLRPGRSKKENH